jgi:hypothetical protein
VKNQNNKVRGKKSVPATPPTRALPAPNALQTSRQVRLPAAPAAQRQLIKDVFLNVVGGNVLSTQLKPFVTAATAEEAARGAELIVEAIRESVQPQDALEEMLVVQMAWAHARLARLSAIAHSQEQRGNVQVVNDACDRAANTFRRQMLALAEYRRPAQAGSFVAIKQANVANQQVVQNVDSQQQSPKIQKPDTSNEQGLAPPALPPVAERIEVPTGDGAAEQAVAAKHRPPDAGRQGPIQAERDQAWRA